MSFEAPAPVPDPAAMIGVDSIAGPQAQVSPEAPRRRGARRAAIIVGSVLAVAVIAGLIVWAPWNPPPVAPALLRGTSPTATSISLSWPKPNGGATVDHYVILKAGQQVATVPAGQTTWTDTSARPGETYSYAVATAGGGTQSGPSPVTMVTAITPQPVAVSATETYTSVTLGWKPSPLGPAPSQYILYNGSTLVETLDGTTTSYIASSLQPGTPFAYSVVAAWGSHKSAPSMAAKGSTLSPPLNSDVPVQVTTTSVPAGTSGQGKQNPYTWNFSATCQISTCSMTAYATVPNGDGSKGYTFPVTLNGSNAGFSGTFGDVKSACSSVNMKGTAAVRIAPVKSSITDGAWGHWTGTVVVSFPYTNAGAYYCPAESWSFSVSGGGQPATAA